MCAARMTYHQNRMLTDRYAGWGPQAQCSTRIHTAYRRCEKAAVSGAPQEHVLGGYMEDNNATALLRRWRCTCKCFIAEIVGAER